MLDKWNEMPKKDQNLILILICALMIGAYTGVVYLSLGEKVFETEKKVSRKENRLNKKTQQLGKLEDPSVYEKKIALIQPELEELTKTYNQLKNGFVPLDDLEKVESLRLELAEQARITGIVVRSMKTVGARRMDSDSVPDDASKKLLLSNPFERMLININSYTTFTHLLKFLDGLDELSYFAVVVQLNIKAVVPLLKEGEYEKASRKKLIAVNMTIAI